LELQEVVMTQIQNILVPVDFSDHSAKAIEMAVDVARAFGGATLHLLHCYQIQPVGVSPYGIVVPEAFDRDIRDAASQKLGEWREKVAADGVDVRAHLSSLLPSLAIQDAIGEVGADLVVMGTRGLSGIKHVLLGSVAERTLRTATCPVLTVKSSDDDD
jgi:nucleotide-binding universal stress UspA family protein